MKVFLSAHVASLVFVATSVAAAAGQSIGDRDVRIVAAPGTHVPAQPLLFAREFEPAGACAPRAPSQGTARGVLGQDVQAILVHKYDRAAFGSISRLTAYIRRILVANPEGGAPQSHPYWSEGYSIVMNGSLEYRDGRRSRIELGKGYLHFEDGAGCQWWGRYLGGDRQSWVVPN